MSRVIYRGENFDNGFLFFLFFPDHGAQELCDPADRLDKGLCVCFGIVQICVVCSLDAVGEQDVFLRVVAVLGILSEDYLLKFTVQAVSKAVLFFPGKQDPDQGALRHECKAEFPAEHIGIFKCIVFQMVDPADDRSDGFLLHCFRKGVDILVVGVECRFIDACKRAQFFYCDLFQRFLCSQFDKSVPYPAATVYPGAFSMTE